MDGMNNGFGQQNVNLNKNNGFGQQNAGFGQPQNSGFGQQQNTNNHPQFVTYLVLSILMCCCCFNIPGVISGVLTFLGNDAYKHGNMTEAEAKFVLARKVLIAGLIIGILIQVIAWVGGFSSMMLEAIKNK